MYRGLEEGMLECRAVPAGKVAVAVEQVCSTVQCMSNVLYSTTLLGGKGLTGQQKKLG